MKPRVILMRLAAAGALALAALFLGGCLQDRLVWSPDGTRAVIITKDGLHLCDADGKLTPLLMPGVYRAAWLGDSQRLVLARRHSIGDFASLVGKLGPERSQALATKAEIAWRQIQATGWGELNMTPEHAVVIYLREHHGAALRAKLAEQEDAENNLKKLESMTAGWHSLVVVRVVGDRLEPGATLSEGLADIGTIRPSPSGSAVAFVTQIELSPVPDDGLRIFVAPIDGSAPATVVADHTAAHPDWAADRRTLVYLQAASDRAASNGLRIGALVEREVLDAAGRIQLAEKTRELAGLIFKDENCVRCLSDGRVLFAAAEYPFPLAAHDRATRDQLFALDRTKEAPVLTALIRRDRLENMAGTFAGFAVSPDEQQVLFNYGGDVDVLTLASGNVERVVLGAYHDSPFPVWRRPGELVYLKKGIARNELVLRRAAGEIVLSRAWPDEVLARLIE